MTEKLKKQEGMSTKWIDGSKDLLVRFALADLLDKYYEDVEADSTWFLVVDEFHMMNSDQKLQLLRWVSQRNQRIQLVLISNRIDQEDIDVFYFSHFY